MFFLLAFMMSLRTTPAANSGPDAGMAVSVGHVSSKPHRGKTAPLQ